MVEIKHIYEFGDFRLDPINKVLSRNGQTVSVTRKVFDTLNVLVENADRLIEKDELMQKIWQDRFVDESNLTFNIKMIRKALGDSAASPTYIETVPRRGYRFIAEVRKFNAPNGSVPVVNIPQRTNPRFGNIYLFSAALIVILLSSLGIASWWWKNNSGKVNAPVLSAEFETSKISDTGKVDHAIISPNGEFIAYTNQVNGKQGLWLRNIKTANNTPIIPLSDMLYYGLAFSNDSQTLYFTRGVKERNEPMSIYRIAIFGGVPTKISERCQGWISVSPDDKQISFVRYEDGVSSSNKLMVVDVDGKNEREIKISESPKVFWANSFSPDGKTIAAAYGHTNNASQEMNLVEINVETGEQRDLTTEKFFHIKDIEWLPNKSGLIFTADRSIGEPIKILQVNYLDGKVDTLTKDTTSFSKLSLNNDADLLAATTVSADFHLFIQDEQNPEKFKILDQARDKFAFTPDGKIVYATDAAGNEDIWVMHQDGTNQRQLTNDPALDFFPIVSPDNRYIFFTSNRTGESQVWRMNVDGSGLLQISRKNGGYPRFVTPDNKFLYYQSAMTNELLKVSADGGEEIPLGEKLGYFQSFSPDGSRVAYLYRDKETNKTMLGVMAIETKAILQTFAVPENIGVAYYLRWQNETTLAYSMDSVNSKDSIWIQKLNETRPQLLHDLDDEEFMDIQFSPDGKKTAFIRGNWRHDAFLIKGLN